MMSGPPRGSSKDATSPPTPTSKTITESHIANLIVRLENIQLNCRIPKLSAIALLRLPSPRILLSDTDQSCKEARLVYTAPVSDMESLLEEHQIPCWKISKADAPLATNATDHADCVPWVRYDCIPRFEKSGVDDLPPPSIYRFKPSPAVASDVTPLHVELDSCVQEIWRQLFSFLEAQGYSPDKARDSMEYCNIDFLFPDSSVWQAEIEWPEHLPSIKEVKLVISGYMLACCCRGPLCDSFFQSASFTGLTRIAPKDLVERLNGIMATNATIVDLWQEFTTFKTASNASEIVTVPLQNYEAVFLLFDEKATAQGFIRTVAGEPFFVAKCLPRRLQLTERWSVPLMYGDY